jgi:proline iminopeptidase
MKSIRLIIGLMLIACSVNGQQVRFFKTSDGESLFYTRIGHGPTVIFLCGGPGYSVNFLQQLADSLSSDFECILFDQRGTGLSTTVKLDSTTINLVVAARDLEDLRIHLGQKQLILCGISWGGGLAQIYASYYPENLKEMVLISTMGPDLTFLQTFEDNIRMRRYPNEKDSLLFWNSQSDSKDADLKRLLFYQLPYFFDHNAGYKIILKDFANISYNPQVGDLMWKDISKNYDLKSRLINYKGICVIFKSRQDIVPESVAYEIKELLPQTKIITIERSGHYPHLENPNSFYLNFKKAFLTPEQIR